MHPFIARIRIPARKIVYIAHPIGGDVEENVTQVSSLCKALHSPEIIPIAPYLSFLDEKSAETRKMGFDSNRQFFLRKMIDEVWLCGPRISPGMKEEIKWALDLRIPVRCHNPALEPALQTITQAFEKGEIS